MTTTISAPSVRPSIPPAVPVLPESAPFSAAQRAWLNGFFAGMLGGQVAAASNEAREAQSSNAATIETATPEQEEQFPWHDPAIPLDERLKLAEGKSQRRKLMAALAQLDCGACGYLCQTYAEAIADGQEKDLTRCTPGGRETARMLKQLQSSAPAAQKPVAHKMVPVSEVKSRREPEKQKSAAETTEPPAWSRNNPFPARLLQSKPLNGAGSAKDTRLVTIDLRNSGISYKPGDALGVFPENHPDLVCEVLKALGATGAEEVPGWEGQPISLYDALLRDFTITRPTPDLLDILSRRATDPRDSEALVALRDSEDGAGDLHVLDLLRKFPSARPAPSDFVATLAPLAPRLYSISSSLRACAGQVHLTVGAVRYANSIGRDCAGVASTFLADGLRPGQAVRVFVHTSHKFGLPEDGNTPIIMIGPGTGIAPFRAFLQEREASSAPGKNWLFFGDQKSECDFLYRDELEAWQRSGLLTRLDTAFSRDQADKIYVQQRMLENAAELWSWIQQGAHFYVCGDAQRMAADVDKALRRIIAEQAGMTPPQADQFVADLIRSGRYQRDVY